MVHPTLPSTVFRTSRLFLVLCLVLCGLLSSCVTLEHARDLRDAQDLFNAGSELENQLALDLITAESGATIDGQTNSAITQSGRISSNYSTALARVTFLINKKEKKLRDDNLLGTAYVLKALAEWRLGEYAKTETTIQNARDSEATFFPRDEALLAALPGLIKNDSAFSKMNLTPSPDESDATQMDRYVKTRAMLSASIEKIGDGISGDPGVGHIRLYLLTSQLAALKNWTNLRGDPSKYGMKFPEGASRSSERTVWCEQATPVWATFEKEVTRLGNQNATAMRETFASMLSLPDACAASGN